VSGILIFPPYYPTNDDDGIVAYYKTIADATPLGVIIYSRDWFKSLAVAGGKNSRAPFRT